MSVVSSDERPVTVALVNNMPDSAFVDTEDQFRCVTEAAGVTHVDLDLYTITEIPRSPAITSLIAERYHGLDELWTRTPDALIVTGTEPTMPQMALEPYWPHLATLLEWASDAVGTVLLSCLASHASLQLFDGIERTPRAHKCSGVFRGVVADPGDPLAVGLPAEVSIPHSRLNEVDEEALRDAGYRIVVGGGGGNCDVGWSVAAREQRGSLFVLCQGHPEYGTLSLLREYRRDVRRFLFAEGEVGYPTLPEGYLSRSATRRLEGFAERALRCGRRGRDPHHLWTQFPFGEVARGVQNPWAQPSHTLYANWITLARAASHVVA